jgi:hypothetical protein
LAALAKYLNIPLNGARLSDEAEQAINDEDHELQTV